MVNCHVLESAFLTRDTDLGVRPTSGPLRCPGFVSWSNIHIKSYCAPSDLLIERKALGCRSGPNTSICG